MSHKWWHKSAPAKPEDIIDQPRKDVQGAIKTVTGKDAPSWQSGTVNSFKRGIGQETGRQWHGAMRSVDNYLGPRIGAVFGKEERNTRTPLPDPRGPDGQIGTEDDPPQTSNSPLNTGGGNKPNQYGYNYESIRNTEDVKDKDGNIIGNKGELKPGYSMTGGAPWAKARLAAEDINRGTLLDNATRESLGQRLGAETALAARGGLMGGARERLMRSSSQNVNAARQGVRLQSELNKLGIQSKAADLDREAERFNISNMIGDVAAGNLAAEENLNRRLVEWAAGQQARGILKG